MALRTPTAEAEEIKIRYGVAKQVLADPGDRWKCRAWATARATCRARRWPP
jgi:cell division ATPase FtsA